MRNGMRKPSRLKVIRYVASLVNLNEYLSVFPGSQISDKICVTELNETLLNSRLNSWSNQVYSQVFYCGSMTFKASVNMF